MLSWYWKFYLQGNTLKYINIGYPFTTTGKSWHSREQQEKLQYQHQILHFSFFLLAFKNNLCLCQLAVRKSSWYRCINTAENEYRNHFKYSESICIDILFYLTRRGMIGRSCVRIILMPDIILIMIQNILKI